MPFDSTAYLRCEICGDFVVEGEAQAHEQSCGLLQCKVCRDLVHYDDLRSHLTYHHPHAADMELADVLSNFCGSNSCYSEPLIVDHPLAAHEFRNLINFDGSIRLAIPLSLDELYACRGIDGFNDLVDSMLYGEGVHGCLTGVMYRPMRVLDDERVLVEVIASIDDLEFTE